MKMKNIFLFGLFWIVMFGWIQVSYSYTTIKYTRTEEFTEYGYHTINACDYSIVHLQDSQNMSIRFNGTGSIVNFTGVTIFAKFGSSAQQFRFQFFKWTATGWNLYDPAYFYTGYVVSVADTEPRFHHINYSISLVNEATIDNKWMVYVWFVNSVDIVLANVQTEDYEYVSDRPQLSYIYSPWYNMQNRDEFNDSVYRELVDIRTVQKTSWEYACLSYSARLTSMNYTITPISSIVTPAHFNISNSFYFNISSTTDIDMYITDFNFNFNISVYNSQDSSILNLSKHSLYFFPGYSYEFSCYVMELHHAYTRCDVEMIPANQTWTIRFQHRDNPASIQIYYTMSCDIMYYDTYYMNYDTSSYFFLVDLMFMGIVVGISYMISYKTFKSMKEFLLFTLGIISMYSSVFSSDFAYSVIVVNIILLIILFRRDRSETE